MTNTGDFQSWIGRATMRSDLAAEAPLRRLAALFDRPGERFDSVSPLGHWLYFLPEAAEADLGEDGHPKPGRDQPDFGLKRRMWAGSRIEFLRAVAVGVPIERRTTIVAIARKTGSTGPLAFLTLRHEVGADGEISVVEEQDLVFRAAADTGSPPSDPSLPPQAAPSVPPAPAISRPVTLGPVQLFRFSALTFNAHRIHYDRDYARTVEFYPGLVAHGPYQAMLLMDLFRRTFPGRPVRRFSFRAQSPLFASQPALLVLDPTEDGGELSVRSSGDRICMTASVAA